jgi:hypothetical protein
MRILPTAHLWFLFQWNIALRLRIRERTEVFRKGCLIKASPLRKKWYATLRLSGSLCKTKSFPILFSERRAASEKLMKDYARGRTEAQLIEALETLQKPARNELELNDPPRGRKVRRKSKP